MVGGSNPSGRDTSGRDTSGRDTSGSDTSGRDTSGRANTTACCGERPGEPLDLVARSSTSQARQVGASISSRTAWGPKRATARRRMSPYQRTVRGESPSAVFASQNNSTARPISRPDGPWTAPRVRFPSRRARASDARSVGLGVSDAHGSRVSDARRIVLPPWASPARSSQANRRQRRRDTQAERRHQQNAERHLVERDRGEHNAAPASPPACQSVLWSPSAEACDGEPI